MKFNFQQNPNFFELEQKILKWWKDNKILEKSIENRSEERIKSFYDGPITANGSPHHGHMLTFVMKDVIPRYWTMKGYRVSRSLGWDCHGLPVEWEIEKTLGFKEKKDIEKFGIDKFNQLCKESVEKYINDIVSLEEMCGRITNSEEEYSTMDPKYIESIWWSLKELYVKGLLYEGFKVVPYSTRAGTVLSNAEVALGGYKKIVDPAITVKFKLEGFENTYLLAWTTTPWTIPSNLALAIKQDIKYIIVSDKKTQEKYIIAADLINSVFKNSEIEYLSDVDFNKLINQKYVPPFDYFIGRANCHKVVEGFHVTTDVGTGIVHLAPYGIEDNEIFGQIGIESFDVLDEQGDFNEIIHDLKGLNYRDANKIIIQQLKDKNLLFDFEEYEHEMPMCWRTNTPLIYKPLVSWYIATSKLRENLVENNSKINWTPGHIKEGRFGNWLSEIKDWSISRKRYWGTPLPIWKSQSGKVILIGSFEELEKLSGIKISDPHRPYIDEIHFKKDGEVYYRIPDVLDVWYDSGAMPFARFHYPFENTDKFTKKFPADYISESIDQTRGWFYSLHAISTALFNSESFKNIVVTGHILGEDGNKLSKSKKNYTPPVEMIKKFGADAIRLDFLSSPICNGENAIISDRTVKIQTQELLLPLWNVFVYFCTYANIHNWELNEDYAQNIRTDENGTPNHIKFEDLENEIDIWIVTKLQDTIKFCNKYLDDFDFNKAYNKIKDFVVEVSKWYIRRNRERFTEGDKSVIDILFYVIVEIVKLLAPIAPFISEYIYREIVAEHSNNLPESVHLCDYPICDENFLDNNKCIIDEMNFVKEICEMGHSIRNRHKIKLRQPLRNINIVNLNPNVSSLSQWMKDIITNELNIKEIYEVIDIRNNDNKDTYSIEENTNLKVKIAVNIQIDQDLLEEGFIRELNRSIQFSRKKMQLNISQRIKIYMDCTETYKNIINKYIDNIKKATNAVELIFLELKNTQEELVVDITNDIGNKLVYKITIE